MNLKQKLRYMASKRDRQVNMLKREREREREGARIRTNNS
jgi:hypothetical protein